MSDPWLTDAEASLVHYEWALILADHGRADGHATVICHPAGDLTIFDNPETAEAAVAELAEAGSPRLYADVCEYSEEQHWHIKTGG